MRASEQARIDALFEQLFEQHQGPILSYLCRLLGSIGQAEELTQDVFLKAYQALGRLPDDANHRAWLYRIATNAAYDQLRRRKLIQWLPLMDHDASRAAEPADVEGQIGSSQAVQKALGHIPLKYRAPLVLYSVQGYSVAEISEILDISQGAVKTRLYRAREQFRKAYGGDG